MTAVASLVVGKLAAAPTNRRVAAVGGSLLLAGAATVVWAAPGVEERFLATVLLCAAAVAGAVAAVVGPGTGSRAEVLRAGVADLEDLQYTDDVAPARAGSMFGRRGRSLGVVAIVAGLFAVGAFAVAGNADTCSDGEAVTVWVGVAPEIEPAVTKAVERFNDARHEIGGTCVQADATVAAPAQVASLLGQAAAPGTAAPPDAWIPDSSLWTSLLTSGVTSGRAVATTETSVAQTPVVVTMPQATAEELRRQGMAADPSWADLVGGAGQPAGSPPAEGERVISTSLSRLQVPDPARNATGLATLVLAGELGPGEPGEPAKFAEAARKLRTETVTDVAAGFAGFQAGGTGQYPLLVAPEQAMIAYNQTNPAEPAVPVYPRDGVLSLDYPFVVTTADTARADGARLLEAELRDEQTQADVRALGFRTAGGAPPAALETVPEANPQPLPVPPVAEVHTAMQTWQILEGGIRNLTLLDISASMSEPVGPELNRLKAAGRIIEAALTPMPDDAEMGVWLFGHRLINDQDWAAAVTVGRLSDKYGPAPRREQIKFGLSRFGTVPESRTGLYDSVLAAFRTMMGNYAPEKANSMLVFTDGTDDAPGGVSLEDLLTALRDEYDPARPVHIVVVGIGDGVDRGVLEQIAGATRGRVHLVTTPEQVEQIQQILLTDLSRHTTEN